MKSFERTVSTSLIFLFEALLICGVVFDWVWFIGLELSMFISTSVILTLITWIATIFIFSIYGWLTSFNWKKNEWGLNFKNKKTRRNMLVVLFLLGSFFMFASFWEVRNLNDVHHIAINNSERHYLMINETNWVFYVSAVNNITSSMSTRISVWIDHSYFKNATMVIGAYFNGTSYIEGANRTTDEGLPNFSWWTDDSYIWWNHTQSQDSFGNFTHRNHIPFDIPTQKANTTVEFMFFCRTMNGSDISYITLGGNYTVLYSPTENETNNLLITQSHFLLGLSLWFIVLDIKLFESITTKLEEDFTSQREAAIVAGIIRANERNPTTDQLIEQDRTTYPPTQDMILRSDRLDDVKNNHRNASGAFIGLSVAFVFYIQSHSSLLVSFQLMYLSILFAILVNLYTLVISLNDDSVKINDIQISHDMLPQVDNENDFRFFVYLRIRKQLHIINRMRKPLQIGVYAILCGLIGDFVKVFLIIDDVLRTNWLSFVIYFVSAYSAFFLILLSAWWILRELGASYNFPD